MPRPITAVIHQSALRHNLAIARAAMPDSQVFAVVKAMNCKFNGYNSFPLQHNSKCS